MKSWPSKILFILVIYFAGFATAIYGLAPVDRSDEVEASTESKVFLRSFTKSNDFALSCGNKLRELVGLAEGAAKNAGRNISDSGIQIAALDKIRTFGITGTNGATASSDQANR